MTGLGVLGFCGLAGAGKDSAAAHLVSAHGYRRVAFADGMRDALYALDPFVTTRGGTYSLQYVVDHHGWDQAKQLPDVRRLLQRFGTEVGREMWGPSFWVERAVAGVAPGSLVVFTDVRFPNEAEGVRALGGRVVEIRRPGAGLAGATATHASEAMAFQADRVLVNDGTVAELHARVDRLMHPSAG